MKRYKPYKSCATCDCADEEICYEIIADNPRIGSSFDDWFRGEMTEHFREHFRREIMQLIEDVQQGHRELRRAQRHDLEDLAAFLRRIWEIEE